MKAGDSVVIVGASGGISIELVKILLRKGLKVFGADLNAEKLEEMRLFHERQGETFEYAVVDVCDEAQLQLLSKEVLARFGRIDFWINAAGVPLNKEFVKSDLKSFFKVMDVNFNGLVRGTRFALDIMNAQASGQILNIASVAGHVAAPFMSAYVASKFAVIGFTRSVQTELLFQDSPVTLQLISPGFVKTGMIKIGESMGFPEWLQFLLSEPAEVAQAIVKAMKSKKLEVNPTMNGRMMLGMHRMFPLATRKSSKILLTRGMKDMVLNRYHIDQE